MSFEKQYKYRECAMVFISQQEFYQHHANEQLLGMRNPICR